MQLCPLHCLLRALDVILLFRFGFEVVRFFKAVQSFRVSAERFFDLRQPHVCRPQDVQTGSEYLTLKRVFAESISHHVNSIT